MMQTSYYKSPFGIMKIIHDNNMIISLSLTNDKYKNTDDCEIIIKLKQELDEYFCGHRKIFTIPYKLSGTDFQVKVWKALCDIPYGKTNSYKDVAAAINNDKACRAVGMANNKNKIMIIVPCHRVIGSSGKLVGYACGLEIKQKLLDLELKYL